MSKRKTSLPEEDERIKEASEIIGEIVEKRQDQVSLSPSWVATEAMLKLDAKWMLTADGNEAIVYRLAHLQCRQIAREFMRRLFEPNVDRDKDQHPLFPNLQWRYPQAHSKAEEEPVYVLLEHMAEADWNWNLNRLTAEASAKIKHRNALEAWGLSHGFRLRA